MHKYSHYDKKYLAGKIIKDNEAILETDDFKKRIEYYINEWDDFST